MRGSNAGAAAERLTTAPLTACHYCALLYRAHAMRTKRATPLLMRVRVCGCFAEADTSSQPLDATPHMRTLQAWRFQAAARMHTAAPRISMVTPEPVSTPLSRYAARAPPTSNERKPQRHLSHDGGLPPTSHLSYATSRSLPRLSLTIALKVS